MSCSPIILCLLVLVCAGGNLSGDEGEKLFREKVEPLLKARCLKCHSHESGKMKGGLTLDSRSGWEKGGDSGPTLVPGDPGKSLLIRAVRHQDEGLKMPPKEKLTDGEIAVLEQWIQSGAADPRKTETARSEDADWWSLKKLVAPQVPGEGHPIDAFVRARLKAAGLNPAAPASRATLARRLYVDLHGYQPTPEEVAGFVEDKDSMALPSLVDRLLASPRYGERWARHWLDAIHFADSHGCEHDVKRPNAWRFRDYVIDRLNDDVPWDRFIREQLAPDVFYPDEPRLTAGLGFIAAGPLELSRASTAPVTFDYLDRDDIVTQTMAAFASTTANCARCHTHKFDPISQEDYYALQAVFAGVGKGDVEYDENAEVAKRRREWNALLTSSDPELLLRDRYAGLVREWEQALGNAKVQWQILDLEVFVASGGATLEKMDDGSIFASGPLAARENYTVSAQPKLKRLAAVRLEVMKDERLPKGGPGRAGNGNMHVTDLDLRWFPPGESVSEKLEISRASADFNQSGWVDAHAIDGDDKTGWAIYPQVNQSHHIVLELARPVDASKGGRLAVTIKQYPPTHHLGRFRLSATDAGNGAAQVLPEKARAGLDKPLRQRSEPELAAIAQVALQEYAKAELAKLPAPVEVYGVSRYWSHAKKKAKPLEPKVVHLLRRGAFDQPVREVGPGALSAITGLPGRFNPPDPRRESSRRAALADWLAHPDNPLTWRSIVNRVWHHHFGRGLSDTPNDFGRMGGEPTHPDLLNWLAVWFRDEAKGSLKELHRLILGSETWQQTSRVRGNGKDADNRLLWRMNRRRIDAETFRDSALRMAGRLDLKMGGPGIEQFAKTNGPQATPSLDYSAFDWNSAGARRRSIYRVVWRGIADPFMEALDFPDLGLLAPKRAFSVSALQSLAVLNNDFVLHAGQWLSERTSREQPTADGQVERLVEVIWLRRPSPAERAEFIAFVSKHGAPAFARLLLNSNQLLFLD